MWKSFKEKGFKATIKQFNHNFKLYDPVDAVTDQIVSCVLFIIGWVFAIVHSIINKNYWLIIMSIGGILMFQSQLRQNIKQRKILKKIKEDVGSFEDEY